MNILVVDGYTLHREGLKCILNTKFPQTLTVEGAVNASSARRVLSVRSFDLILLDLHLNDTQGVDSLINVKQYSGNSPIIVLNSDNNDGVIDKCIANGASGFLASHSTVHDLVIAIQRGRTSTDYSTVHQLAVTPVSDTSILVNLSKRQREVLSLLLKGQPNKSISDHMDISQNTVKAHLSAIFKVLGARNRTEAVYFAARAGLPLE